MRIKNFAVKSELGRYIFWGVMTVAANYFSYLLLKVIMPYQIANIISIIFTKVFAYCTNKKFVFRTKTNSREQIKEIIRYVLGRGFTGVVDFLGLIVLTEVCSVDDKIGKMIMIVITTALNYVLGKLFVFKNESLGRENE